MTWMLKVKTRWSGYNGSPGWTNFFFREFTDGAGPTQAAADAAAVRTEQFFNGIKGIFPPSVTYTVQSDVEEIDDVTGMLTKVWTVPARTPAAGTNAGTNYSAASGMVVTWRSDAVRNGRRVRGRTFLVPVAAACYENDGTIAAANLTTVQSQANGLLATTGTPDFGIYSRPKYDLNKVRIKDGQWSLASAATVPDKAAILKSRRD